VRIPSQLPAGTCNQVKKVSAPQPDLREFGGAVEFLCTRSMQHLMHAIDCAEGLHLWVFREKAELAYCRSCEKRLVCVVPEVGDCMDGGTVYVEGGDLSWA